MARKKTTDPEAKPAKKKKKAPQHEWHKEKPERPAIYNCRIEGRELPLQFKKCPFSGRTYWLYVDGTDVDPNAAVEWRHGKVGE